MPSITEIMAQARRVVHRTFGETAVYTDPHSGAEYPISVRWHNRVAIRGNLADEGYSDIIEGVNRAFFNTEELNQNGITLHKAGMVRLTHPLNGDVILILDSMEPRVGPVQEIWNVVVP